MPLPRMYKARRTFRVISRTAPSQNPNPSAAKRKKTRTTHRTNGEEDSGDPCDPIDLNWPDDRGSTLVSALIAITTATDVTART